MGAAEIFRRREFTFAHIAQHFEVSVDSRLKFCGPQVSQTWNPVMSLIYLTRCLNVN